MTGGGAAPVGGQRGPLVELATQLLPPRILRARDPRGPRGSRGRERGDREGVAGSRHHLHAGGVRVGGRRERRRARGRRRGGVTLRTQHPAQHAAARVAPRTRVAAQRKR